MNDRPNNLAQKIPRLVVQESGAILTVALNRPDKRNAIDDRCIDELDACFSAIPSHTRAILLTGMGEHFSAGLDLSDLTERDATAGMYHSRRWHRCFEKIEFAPTPVIAVLKGAVVGGGLELAGAAHIRVADPSAFFALPEGQRGIFVGGGGSVRLSRLIGVARMADMMLTGRAYSAAEGVSFGFCQYLSQADRALEKAHELAERIATNAPLTNFAVIQALPRIAEADRQTGLLAESLISAIAQSDQEAKLRVRAFLEKKAAKVKAPNN